MRRAAQAFLWAHLGALVFLVLYICYRGAGWRGLFTMMGGLVWAVLLLGAALYVAHDPEDLW